MLQEKQRVTITTSIVAEAQLPHGCSCTRQRWTRKGPNAERLDYHRVRPRAAPGLGDDIEMIGVFNSEPLCPRLKAKEARIVIFIKYCRSEFALYRCYLSISE
jgi:hypothetical protein